MSESILNSVKNSLGLAEDYAPFDPVVIMHINSVFSTLHQLGVGPEMGFRIEDDIATWDAFLGDDPILSHIQTYMYLRVRFLFDPPTTGYFVEAMEKQIKEHEWRINVQREDAEWVDPNPPQVPIL